uniref:Formamidopyrimidine-DNA glycosylase n=1 Tax=Pithovirus LCPAC001 TaxID=2506585 RepID=A0A481Z1H9_9VIRU|nr:MAG: formamidopyrimidine-DNA glycosylase [Pithovirus LCPAC001]
MPEGPEIKTIVDSLNLVLPGLSLNKIIVNEKSRYFKNLKNKNILDSSKLPLCIRMIICKGKHIFFKFESSLNSNEVIIMHSHLAMTGKWIWDKGKHSGIELFLSNQKVLYFDDTRRFGCVEWFNQEQYKKKLKNIGIDILSEHITLKHWNKIMSNTRLKKKQICDMLISQKYISGIGNYLKSEILYLSKIRPDRELQSLTDVELEMLYTTSLKTIKASYNSGGLTIQDYIDPDGNTGKFKVIIYGKKGKKDPNGYSIITSTFKDRRTTFWVKEIQK